MVICGIRKGTVLTVPQKGSEKQGLQPLRERPSLANSTQLFRTRNVSCLMPYRGPIRMLLILVLVAAAARAEIVDRLIAVAGSRVITWSDVLWEARYQAFLLGQEPPGPDALAQKEAREPILERLIDQRLLEQDRNALPFSSPEESATQRRFEEVRQRFFSPEAYREALARYGLAEAELRERLERETNLMAFTESRLRPQVRLDSAETERYYQEIFSAELRRQGQTTIPPLAEVREQIEQVLAEQQVNRRLDEWLRDLRARLGVRILP